MTSSPRTYEIVAMPAETADTFRAAGGEAYVADEMPGYPCRQCLQDAAIGDELILVSYTPFDGDSPYRSASPIFLHRTPCGPPPVQDALPLQLTRRQLSVRAFDADEMMVAATVIEGDELDATLAELLTDEATFQLHIHNAERGCYAVTVGRVT